MFKNPKIKFVRKALLAVLFLSAASAVNAQHSVEFSDEGGVPGDAVVVTFTFTNLGSDSVLEARARISDMGPFTSVDTSALCTNANADFVQCGLNDTNRIVIIATNFDMADELADFTGTVVFNIDAGVDPGTLPQTIDIEWNAAEDDGLTFTPTDATDGSIEILAGPPPPESSLSIAPSPMTFGTIDLGNMPQSQDFTVSIGGDADADDVTISDVTLTGDAEFSIAADNCEGNTFSVPSSCTITIEFDAAADGDFDAEITVTSDADNNSVASAEITGSAGSAPNIVINPPFGPVNLGAGAPGETVSANGTITNTGSAPGDVSCTLAGDPVFSTDPSPLAALVGPGETVNFSLFCALPAESEEGDMFNGTLSCDIDGEPAGEHQLSCEVSTFEPLPVPTMQPWALALFALMMLLVGGISIRFFRAV